MFKFKLGQRVTYLRLGKEGIIAAVDAGLGYYLDCAGWIWSVSEGALSAKIGKRYRTGRKRGQPEKAQPKNPNEIAIHEHQSIQKTGLKSESPCRQGDTPDQSLPDQPQGQTPFVVQQHKKSGVEAPQIVAKSKLQR